MFIIGKILLTTIMISGSGQGKLPYQCLKLKKKTHNTNNPQKSPSTFFDGGKRDIITSDYRHFFREIVFKTDNFNTVSLA